MKFAKESYQCPIKYKYKLETQNMFKLKPKWQLASPFPKAVGKGSALDLTNSRGLHSL